MSSADWGFLANGLSSSDVARGATTAIARPNGGGSFVYGFRSLNATHDGAVGLYVNLTNFTPMAKGGRYSMPMMRAISGGENDFCPILFLLLQAADVESSGYLLGFAEDEEPSYLYVAKAKLEDGIQSDMDNIIMKSSKLFSKGTWYHFEIAAIVQPNDDVILKVKENDLGAYTVSSPTFEAIAGMSDFTDDRLGYQSGSVPYENGYCGFSFRSKAGARTAFFDHIVAEYQT